MRYIALLRAVNIAGKRGVSMGELRALAENVGYRNVRTISQSGNLIFEAGSTAQAAERMLEAQIKRRFQLDVPVVVRSAPELAQVVKKNPFVKEAKTDPGHLLVVFLREKSTASKERALRAAIVGRERIALRGGVLYAVYPDGVGRSKLTAALIDRHLGTTGTARNWNTVLKLLAATSS